MMNLKFTTHYDASWAELLRVNRWQLAVMGNQKVLGEWSRVKAVMKTEDFRTWTVDVKLASFFFPLEYKYVIYNPEKSCIVAWESRENRSVMTCELEAGEAEFVDDSIKFDISMFKGAGVAIPVFSLRSKDGFGVGEFMDLKLLVDWASRTGQRIIQTLPVNDTTLTRTKSDSYPYNVLSVCALHPMYLRLEQMGVLKSEKKRLYFEQERERLNDLDCVDYEQVNALKQEYFELIYKQERKRVEAKVDYKRYVEENALWLYPYAVFCSLRDKYETCDFRHWKKLCQYEENEMVCYAKRNDDEVNFYIYLQYNLHLQLKEVHEYAQSKGVMLKCDIPIGVSPCGADLWQHPELFNAEVQAGAPPDDFSEKGQNWEFPTYNWDEMAKDGYEWWQMRLKVMEQYFDAYRLDHVLGFFRIWEIPSDSILGLLGQFDKSLPLTTDNIEYYGIDFDGERCLNPYVTEDMLERYFGESTADDVRNTFLTFDEDSNLQFRTRFNTQRKVEAYFDSLPQPLAAPQEFIRDGLYKLLSQVLFVKDNTRSDLFHPRISFKTNESYKALSEKEREGYEKLYEEFFYRRNNEFWRQQALNKLPVLINSTTMLACGEDLGMIPQCVPEVMDELNLLSLEIQRMPKQYGQEFDDMGKVPYMCVCSPSSHDTSTLRLWWTEDKEKTQRYYNQVLFLGGDAPEACNSDIVKQILQLHLRSNAMWVIVPIQDWFATDEAMSNPDLDAERINKPDDPHNVWKYRMHVSLEDVLRNSDFNQQIRAMIAKSGRG